MDTCRIIYLASCFCVLVFLIWCHLRSINKKHQDDDLKDLQAVEKGKDDLQFTLESVNSWVNNCDQKASILLAVAGVALTVLMTSDFFKYIKGLVFDPFVKYCLGSQEMMFSWGRFSVFILLVIAAAMLIISCCYLFRAIRANIDYKKLLRENPGIEKTSFVFFGTISKMAYEDFKKGGIEFSEDLQSQIYVNSKIATAKFENYNEGLYWFKLMLLVCIMLSIVILFMG